MRRIGRLSTAAVFLRLAEPGLQAQTHGLPSETPATFKASSESWDYDRREDMIPSGTG